MKTLLFGGLIAVCGALSLPVAAAPVAGNPPSTVGPVDLDRYMGLWYEIASVPQPFSRGCVGSTAEYALRDDGNVDVRNSCRIGDFSGPQITAVGVARSVSKFNDKLKVMFQEPFEGDYWIVDLAEDYSYAVVSGPDRSSLWILNRSAQMEAGLLRDILGRLEDRGFDTGKLNLTPQP
jgi:apolipoprotein D and lipocalin family protein